MVSESGPAGCVRRAGALQLSITVDFPLSMEPELFDGDSVLVDHSRCDPVEGEIFALRTLEGPLVKRLRFHDDRWWASSDNDSPQNGSRPLARLPRAP